MTKKDSINQLLQSADIAIHNALNVDYIFEALLPFGYDVARLEAAQGLLEAAKTAVAHHVSAYSRQYKATNDLQAARQTANGVYMNAVKIARVAFQNDVQARATLRLAGGRAQGLAGWLAQATTFYQNLLAHPALLAAMVPFGYNADRLAAELAQVRAVEAASQRQEAAKGAARAATQNRNEKLRALRAWLADFRVVAPIALADNMQALEALNLRVVA